MARFKRIALGGANVTPWFADLGLSVLRIFTGLAMALAHGWGKVPPGEGLVMRAGEMGFPAPSVFAWVAALCEFAGGLLLAAGLFTRGAAVAVLSVMGVAAFVAHAGDPFGDRERALLFGAIALAFVFVGSGRYSADRLLGLR